MLFRSERETVETRLEEMQAPGADWSDWHQEEYKSLSARLAKIRQSLGAHHQPGAPDHPFEEPYYWAAFATHGAVRGNGAPDGDWVDASPEVKQVHGSNPGVA